MGETRVDLLHLLEDLADAYPGDLEETVLTEIIANALDSGATAISLSIDPTAPSLTVVDDGVGMRRAELRRFHDVAASVKTRGEGIGFAGVGIKLGLLVSSAVVTESRRGKDHVATTWGLTNRKRAPWRWIEPPGLVTEHGTAVRLVLPNALSPLLDPALMETVLRRHFAPMFDPRFRDVLAEHYPDGIRFRINGAALATHRHDTPLSATAPITIRLARKRKPSAFGFVARSTSPLPDGEQGIAVSTLGKVIKRGWDWLGLAPHAANRVSGLVEVPALAACLTLNKEDFLKSGPRGATYLAYRKALQEAISSQLAEWGDSPEDEGREPRRAARPIERDVEQVLADLADRFPLLSTLVQQRAGGRRKRAVGGGAETTDGELAAGTIDMFAPPAAESNADDGLPPPVPTAKAPPPPPIPPSDVATPASRRGVKRPVRLGLTIQFETRADDPEMGRLAESTVWVNDAHPAYQRAAASRSESYHIALSVAMALARVAVEPAQEHAFITEFLASWGDSSGTRRGKRRRSRGPTKRTPGA